MRFTITRKLYASFFAILILLFSVGILSQTVLKNTDEQYRFLLDDRVKKVMIVKDIINSQKEQAADIRGYILYRDTKYIEKYSAAEEIVLTKLKELDGMSNSQKGKELFGNLQPSLLAYNQFAREAIEAIKNGDEAKLAAVAAEASKSVDSINQSADAFMNYQVSLMNEAKAEIKRNQDTTTLMIWMLTIASVVIGGIISFLIGRSIAKPINIVSGSLRRISDGDLTIERIKVKSRDEIGEMVQYLNIMVEDLRNMVGRVNESAVEVAGQSQELSASSEESAAASQMMAELTQLNAAGSEKQLQAINKVTQSVEEMSNGFQQIAISNEGMLEATETVTSVIKEGSVSVQSSAKHMNELNIAMTQISQIVHELSQKSNEISNITGIINGIADQTNLLALNAAIEAARAGEAGKGFAVVADEVRILAEQSKLSSGQIAEMIQSIQQGTNNTMTSIEKGSGIVELSLASSQETLINFKHIEESVNNVGERIQTVAAATQQMNVVVQHILDAVEQVQEVAKQAAQSSVESSAATEEQVATMEQISGSAQSLAFLAEKLQAIISTFKV